MFTLLSSSNCPELYTAKLLKLLKKHKSMLLCIKTILLQLAKSSGIDFLFTGKYNVCILPKLLQELHAVYSSKTTFLKVCVFLHHHQ